MLFNELAFPPHEGLPWRPGPPTVDGFVEPEPNILTAEIEAGYTNGGRFDFGGDTNVPIGVIQCIRHATKDLLYLGLIARFDPSFDDTDFVMIVLRPDAAAGPSDQDRQLIIKPVSKDADGAAPALPELPGPGHIRTDREPFVHPVKVRGRDTSPSPPQVWKDLGPITNLVPKVRSAWSGTGKFWSVELQIPTKKLGTDGGGSDWIDLVPAGFGLYVNIARAWYVGSVIHVDQSTWPFDPALPLAYTLVDPYDNYEVDWDAPILGTGMIVTSQASNPAKGVKFQYGASSIGVLSGGSIGTTLDMATGANNTLVARLANTGTAAADVEATFRLAEFGIPGPGWTNGNANVAWRVIADTMGQDNVGPNPTLAVNLPGGTVSKDATLTWKISAQDHSDYQALWSDQCLWVQLESATGANIVQSSVRQNLSLIHQMSRVEKKATVDGRGFGPSATGGGKHDIVLHVATMPIPRPKLDDHRLEGGDDDGSLSLYAETFGPHLTEAMLSKPGNGDVLGWLSIVNAYRVTDKWLTIAGKKHRVMVHGGSYGFIAQHQLESGETAVGLELGHALADGGIRYHRGGIYELSVPENGKVTLTNVLEPRPAGSGDVPDSPGTGCLFVIVGWFRRLLNWIKGLFGK